MPNFHNSKFNFVEDLNTILKAAWTTLFIEIIRLFFVTNNLTKKKIKPKKNWKKNSPELCLDLVGPYAICKIFLCGTIDQPLLHLQLIWCQPSLQFESHEDQGKSGHHKSSPGNIRHGLVDLLRLQHIVQARNMPKK